MAASSAKKFAKYYCTMNGRAAFLISNARVRARKIGVEFLLTKEWVRARLETGRCEVTGLPFSIDTGCGKGGGGLNSFSPSLDRLDPQKGYTPDNVQVVVWIYNRAKGLFPVEDLILMATALLEQQKDRAA